MKYEVTQTGKYKNAQALLWHCENVERENVRYRATYTFQVLFQNFANLQKRLRKRIVTEEKFHV